MENEAINHLRQFIKDYRKWDTAEFTQADMITELNFIVKKLGGC